MGLSGVSIFFVMGGALGLRMLQALRVPLDGVTFVLGLWNFAAVGVLAVFYLPLPLRLKQGAQRSSAAAQQRSSAAAHGS